MPPTDEVARNREALEARYGPWRPTTLDGALDRVAAAHPDRPWIIGERVSATYREMAEWSRRLARGLLAAGVAAGDRVALVLPNWPELVAARFAVARVGAIAVPVSYRLQAQELATVLEHCEPAVLITMESFREVDALGSLDRMAPGWDRPGTVTSLVGLRLVVTVPEDGGPGLRGGVPTLADLARAPDPALDAELARRGGDPDAVATIFYTSGTTGRPKGVLSTHDMELRSAYGSAYSRAFEDGRRVLFALPLNHVFAYVEGMLTSLLAAGSVVLQSSFDPEATLEAIERHRVNEALFVPTMSLAVVEAARRRPHDLSSLHSVMSAAQAAPARLWTDLYDQLGLRRCVTAYGMSETSAATTFTDPDAPVEDLVGTVGKPKPGGVAGDPALGGRLAVYKTVDPVTLGDLHAGQEVSLWPAARSSATATSASPRPPPRRSSPGAGCAPGTSATSGRTGRSCSRGAARTSTSAGASWSCRWRWKLGSPAGPTWRRPTSWACRIPAWARSAAPGWSPPRTPSSMARSSSSTAAPASPASRSRPTCCSAPRPSSPSPARERYRSSCSPSGRSPRWGWGVSVSRPGGRARPGRWSGAGRSSPSRRRPPRTAGSDGSPAR